MCAFFIDMYLVYMAEWEFSLVVYHIQGRVNVAADALSRSQLDRFSAVDPGCSSQAISGAGVFWRSSGTHTPRLDLASLEQTVSHFFAKRTSFLHSADLQEWTE